MLLYDYTCPHQVAQALHLAPSRYVLSDLSRVLHESRTLPMGSWAGPAEDASLQEFGVCFAFACKAMNSTKPQGLPSIPSILCTVHICVVITVVCLPSDLNFWAHHLGISHCSSHIHTVYRWINQLSFRSCSLFSTAAEKMLPEYSNYGHGCIPH